LNKYIYYSATELLPVHFAGSKNLPWEYPRSS